MKATENKSLYDKIERGINQRENGSVQRASFLDTVNGVALFIFLFIMLSPYHGTVHTTEHGSKLSVPLEEVMTVHNTGISILLLTSAWVLLSPPIERRESRPMA